MDGGRLPTVSDLISDDPTRRTAWRPQRVAIRCRLSDLYRASALSAGRALHPSETNPLDFVPDKILFDTPYGPPKPFCAALRLPTKVLEIHAWLSISYLSDLLTCDALIWKIRKLRLFLTSLMMTAMRAARGPSHES